jgi:hypothetical protein
VFELRVTPEEVLEALSGELCRNEELRELCSRAGGRVKRLRHECTITELGKHGDADWNPVQQLLDKYADDGWELLHYTTSTARDQDKSGW